MIEFNQECPTSATVAFAIGAAMLAGQINYPPSSSPYEICQIGSTYSDYAEKLALNSNSEEEFVREVASFYNTLLQNQQRLGPEFERAIFDDLEELYEA